MVSNEGPGRAGDALPRPPFDRELEAVLATLAEAMPPLTPESIPARRADATSASERESLTARGLVTRDVVIPGYRGDEITLSVIAKPGHVGRGPALYALHGGGMVFGDRWTGIDRLVDWIDEHDAVAVTVEYRLAPEFPDPVPIEDCYAGLVWVAEHPHELGIDPSRITIVGASAGGGLAAGATLLARDRGGPAILGQILLCPMIDDRDATLSTRQIDGVGVWDRQDNRAGWSALLGDRRGTDDVSAYAAPARAVDLVGLPPAFIECGSAEVFRDEDIAYASRLWAAGVPAELHVWSGGFHGFDRFAPRANVSQAAVAARNSWLRRLLVRTAAASDGTRATALSHPSDPMS